MWSTVILRDPQEVCYTGNENFQVRTVVMSPRYGIQATISDCAYPNGDQWGHSYPFCGGITSLKLDQARYMEKYPAKSSSRVLWRRKGHRQQSWVQDLSQLTEDVWTWLLKAVCDHKPEKHLNFPTVYSHFCDSISLFPPLLFSPHFSSPSCYCFSSSFPSSFSHF